MAVSSGGQATRCGPAPSSGQRLRQVLLKSAGMPAAAALASCHSGTTGNPRGRPKATVRITTSLLHGIVFLLLITFTMPGPTGSSLRPVSDSERQQYSPPFETWTSVNTGLYVSPYSCLVFSRYLSSGALRRCLSLTKQTSGLTEPFFAQSFCLLVPFSEELSRPQQSLAAAP